MPLKRGRVIAAGLLATFLAVYGASSREVAGKKEVAVPAKQTRKLVVYYFHTDARCFTCMKFERLTKEVMETRFADDLKKGRLEFRVVNVDQNENEHFIIDYQLYSKSVILSDTTNGKQTLWKNLDQIWNKVRDESAYKKYIETEVRAYLGT